MNPWWLCSTGPMCIPSASPVRPKPTAFKVKILAMPTNIRFGRSLGLSNWLGKQPLGIFFRRTKGLAHYCFKTSISGPISATVHRRPTTTKTTFVTPTPPTKVRRRRNQIQLQKIHRRRRGCQPSLRPRRSKNPSNFFLFFKFHFSQPLRNNFTLKDSVRLFKKMPIFGWNVKTCKIGNFSFVFWRISKVNKNCWKKRQWCFAS